MRKIWLWYRFARRRTLHLRRLCVNLLSIAFVVDRVLRLVEHMTNGVC